VISRADRLAAALGELTDTGRQQPAPAAVLMNRLADTRADFGEEINVSFGIDIRRPAVSQPTVLSCPAR
jgi:hypothetical protein